VDRQENSPTQSTSGRGHFHRVWRLERLRRRVLGESELRVQTECGKTGSCGETCASASPSRGAALRMAHGGAENCAVGSRVSHPAEQAEHFTVFMSKGSYHSHVSKKSLGLILP
jgi:hypothetical protein